MSNFYISKKHIENIHFILATYIDTHNYEGNVHEEDLEAAQALLDKIEKVKTS